MGRIANHLDGAALLNAIGVDTRYVRKAIITIELNAPVIVTTERYGEFKQGDEALEVIRDRYEVTLKETTEDEQQVQLADIEHG